jgi:agmatine/peptidylarginine deiminase
LRIDPFSNYHSRRCIRGKNMKKLAYLSALCIVMFACQQSVDLSPPIPEGLEPAVNFEELRNRPMLLPAYEMEWEKKVPGKVDANDDYRTAHPQWYSITEPPALPNFRPMNEWEPMQAMLITFSDGLVFDVSIAATMVDIVTNSAAVGKVWVVTTDEKTAQSLRIKLKLAGMENDEIDASIQFFYMPNDAFWFIDYGPFPLIDNDTQTVAFADFIYYPNRVHDDAIPTRLANEVGITTYRSPFHFEGGNFQADGEKYCYFSERVYGYTGMSFEQVQDVMQTYYGCEQAVVLKDITNDGTGHIDMFFKLGARDTAIVGEYTVVTDAANEARMDDNQKILESLVYDDGTGIKVYRLPFPHPSQGIPRTFINSTLFNAPGGKVNLWPVYTVDKDLEAEALAVWEEALPDWEHVGVISDDISVLSGAVHCVTRTIPDLPFQKWVADGTCTAGQCAGDEDAYDGACLPVTEPASGCWGPKWECLCNNCNAAGCGLPDACGDGTCDALDGEDCFTCSEDCGCAEGQHCNIFTGECDSCGDEVCSEGENCNNCPYDCGCEASSVCVFGVCTKYPCGGIPYQGCCDGTVTIWCGGGTLQGQDCGKEGCGWDGEKNTCGGDSHGDPSDEYPLDCHDYDYPIGCGEKECGDNGGGFSCGDCKEGFACSSEGICDVEEPTEDVVIQPDTSEEDIVAEPDFTPDSPYYEDLGPAVTVDEEPVEKKSGKKGCSTGNSGSLPAAGLILLLVLGLALTRRFAWASVQ